MSTRATASPAPNRRLIALAGTIVMICFGTVYSWSIFTRATVTKWFPRSAASGAAWS